MSTSQPTHLGAPSRGFAKTRCGAAWAVGCEDCLCYPPISVLCQNDRMAPKDEAIWIRK